MLTGNDRLEARIAFWNIAIGDKIRYSYCDGPSWCCGDSGTITGFTVFEGMDCVLLDDDEDFDLGETRRIEKI